MGTLDEKKNGVYDFDIGNVTDTWKMDLVSFPVILIEWFSMLQEWLFMKL